MAIAAEECVVVDAAGGVQGDEVSCEEPTKGIYIFYMYMIPENAYNLMELYQPVSLRTAFM
jgi:hypothetical protein